MKRRLKIIGGSNMLLLSWFQNGGGGFTTLRLHNLDFSQDRLSEFNAQYRAWLDRYNPDGYEYQIEYHIQIGKNPTIDFIPDHVDIGEHYKDTSVTYLLNDETCPTYLGVNSVSLILLVDESDIVKFKLLDEIKFGVDPIPIKNTILLEPDGSIPRTADGAKRGF